MVNVSGRVQKIAATIAAAVACAGAAHAGELAGTTLRDRSGWSASLFVSPRPAPQNYTEPAPPIELPPAVNASISRSLAKGLRLSFDVKNVFDRRIPSDNYLFQPAEPRGVVIQLRKTF